MLKVDAVSKKGTGEFEYIVNESASSVQALELQRLLTGIGYDLETAQNFIKALRTSPNTWQTLTPSERVTSE